MQKEHLVYIKEDNGGFVVGQNQTTFKPHITYRSIPDENGGYVVYGEPFSKEEHENLFENAHERILRHFALIGLLVDGKPVSKKEFKEKAFDVKYGKGQGSFWAVFFYVNPKEYMYRFAPSWVGGTKALQMTNLYDSFINLVNGDMVEVDSGEIEFGNGGLPLGVFRALKTRFLGHQKEFIV